LCGTVIVDVGEIGICLYVFSGEIQEGEAKPSAEGAAEWTEYQRIAEGLPVVEDLPVLLARVHGMQRGDPPFFAHSFYGADERLVVTFAK
jgi:hypothetical protein